MNRANPKGSARSKMAPGVLVLLAAITIAGCSEATGTPISQRPPGKDISAKDRADKRGDVRILGAK